MKMNNREYEYLDLLEEKNKRLDQYQYEVCIEDNNVVVAAGAGSGKTQVLATRFAWLVMSKNIPCGKILTLTFTNKAAGEMYERIYQTLKFFAENPKTPAIEKQRAQQALLDFSEVHIQTLDSYCGSIVRQVANLYGIRPDFVTGASDDDIKRLALPFVFQNRNEPCVNFFSKPGKLQEFANDIVAEAVSKYTTLATEENHFVNKLNNQVEEICNTWNLYIANQNANNESENSYTFFDIIFALRTLYQDLSEEKKLSPFGIKINQLVTKIDDLENELAKKQLTFEDIQIHSSQDFNQPETKYLINKISEVISFCNSVTLDRAKETSSIREIIKLFKEAKSGISFGQKLLSITSYISQFDYIKNLFELLDKFTLQVNESKRKSGNLSFADISELSLKILLENKELRKQEKAAFERIMIDEFQDNNAKNRDLLFLLSEKEFETEEYGCKDSIPTVEDIKSNKLFFVGDEKQSIYKFRGADVQVFNQLKNDLGRTLQMNNNYRSSVELLSSFNKLFGDATAIFDNTGIEEFEARYLPENFAKKYNPVEQTEVPLPDLTVKTTKTHACMLNTKDLKNAAPGFLSAKDQMGYFIAKKISEIYQQNNEINPDSTHFSDFAILDRSRTNRNSIIKWLNYFEIPYSVDQNSNLFSDGPINDIYNLCRICVYESDVNAFAAYLASPFANLTHASIETILCFDNKTDDEIKSYISAEEFEKYESALNRYSTIRKQILSQSLTKTLETLWEDYGYCYETMLDRKVSLYAEQFDMLFELARQTDENGKSPAWFVDQLAQVKNNEKSSFESDTEIDVKEINYPLEKDDAVQIMTIHKSKGLQFNYVFVYGCTGVSSKGDKSKLFYDEETGLSIAPDEGIKNYFSIKQKEISNLKELAEFRRVIYVALTRACNEIFIIGSWDPTGSTDSAFRLFEKYLLRYDPDSPDLALDLQEIEPAQKSVMWETPARKDATPLSYNERLELLSSVYDKAKIIETDYLETFRLKPSALETNNTSTKTNFLVSQLDDLSELDTIISSYIPEDQKHKNTPDSGEDSDSLEQNDEELVHNYFGYNDYGTLAHQFLEDYVNSGMKEDFSPADYTGGIKLFKNLTDENKNDIINCCMAMCKGFTESKTGSEAKAALTSGRLVKTEWAFRMYQNGILYTGSLDLIFQNPDGTYTLIDYKTNKSKNNEKYILQQKCYKTAAANMLGISEDKIVSKLFYLRYGLEELLDI